MPFDDEPVRGGFDLRDADVLPFDSPLPDDSPDPVEEKTHPLDEPKMQQLHRRIMGMYRAELDRQRENREQMAIDEDFYDSIQWDEEDAQVLRERGQQPISYNVIATSVNWVIGSEKRGRIDFKVLPRKKEDGQPAQRKTELLKYLSSVNHTPFHRSRAFEDTVKVGIGWIEDGADEENDGEIVYSRYESWRNILWDSASTSLDLKDARYIFRSKWVDLDYATAMFPERTAMLTEAAQDSLGYLGDMDSGDEAMDQQENANILGDQEFSRKRVRLIECWVRIPKRVKRLAGGDFSGDIFDEESIAHSEQVEMGSARVAERTMARMHCAILTEAGLVYFDETPYRHNEFPFTPIWGYRRGRDNMPYGMIRNLRDIQQDINKRASKALAILSSNKAFVEEGSVPDIDEFSEEVARPDAVIVYKKGYNPPAIQADRDLAAGHMQLMQQSIGMIQQASGVTDELMGRRTNATSGIAIQARQDQGSLATAKFFDNLRFANQLQGEKQLSLVGQYFDEEKSFRITNQRGVPEFITINDGLPQNDIVRTKADFIISEDEWRVSMRQAQLEELVEVLTTLAPVAPQVVMVMLDLVVESMDIPNRDEIVNRIRQVTGMADPDAEEPTPEQIQRAEAEAQQQQMAMAMAQAELANKQAEAAKKQADAQHSAARVMLIGADVAGKNIGTQNIALDAAAKVATAPSIAPVADIMLKEAGFVGRTEQEAMVAQSARAQEAEAQAMQEQEAAMLEQQAAEQQAMQQQAAQTGEMPPQQ